MAKTFPSARLDGSGLMPHKTGKSISFKPHPHSPLLLKCRQGQAQADKLICAHGTREQVHNFASQRQHRPCPSSPPQVPLGPSNREGVRRAFPGHSHWPPRSCWLPNPTFVTSLWNIDCIPCWPSFCYSGFCSEESSLRQPRSPSHPAGPARGSPGCRERPRRKAGPWGDPSR